MGNVLDRQRLVIDCYLKQWSLPSISVIRSLESHWQFYNLALQVL